jgi:hypothetical protein
LCAPEVKVEHPEGDGIPEWQSVITVGALKKATSARAFCDLFGDLGAAPSRPLRVAFYFCGELTRKSVHVDDDNTLLAFWRRFDQIDGPLKPWWDHGSSPPRTPPKEGEGPGLCFRNLQRAGPSVSGVDTVTAALDKMSLDQGMNTQTRSV